MDKKKDKPTPESKKEREEDLFEEEILNRGDEDSVPEDEEGYIFDEDFQEENEDEEGQLTESDDDYVTAKPSASNPCLRNGFCSRCEGDLDSPEGSCPCRCHDLA